MYILPALSCRCIYENLGKVQFCVAGDSNCVISFRSIDTRDKPLTHCDIKKIHSKVNYKVYEERSFVWQFYALYDISTDIFKHLLINNS